MHALNELRFEHLKKVLIDMDGTITRKSKSGLREEIPGAVSFIENIRLKHPKTEIRIISNNSRSSTLTLSDDLKRIGFSFCASEIVTPVVVLTEFLRKKKYTNIFIIGQDHLLNLACSEEFRFNPSQNIDCVLMGLDLDINYRKLEDACTAIENGADFVTLHRKAVYSRESNRIGPGLGAFVAAVETATMKQATVLGKPSESFMLMQMGNHSPSELLFISDDLPDLIESKRLGFNTALVLSGMTNQKDLGSMQEEMKPDLLFNSIDEICKLI